MKLFKYFFEFIIVIFFFIIFKILGIKNSSNLGCLIFKKIGPLIRNSKKIKKNIEIVFLTSAEVKKKKSLIKCGVIMGEFLQNICTLKIKRK